MPEQALGDAERALLQNEKLVAALERGRKQAENGEGRIVTRRTEERKS